MRYTVTREIKKDGETSAPVVITAKESKEAARAYLAKLATIAESRPRFCRVRLGFASLRAKTADRTEYIFKIR